MPRCISNVDSFNLLCYQVWPERQLIIRVKSPFPYENIDPERRLKIPPSIKQLILKGQILLDNLLKTCLKVQGPVIQTSRT